MSFKKRSLEELSLLRDGSGDSIRVYGRVVKKGFDLSDEDYGSICREHGRKSADDKEKKEGDQVFLKERFVTFLASDETVDSYGDILRVDGADLTRFKSGAAAFITSHDLRDVSGASGVIVKAFKQKGVEGSPDGKALFVTVYFPTAEEDPDADYIFKKYKAGTLKAVSVGLKVIEYYDPESPEERKKIGLGKWGIEVKKWLPYELSAVTVGANPNALMRRAFDQEMIQKIVKEVIAITNKSNNNNLSSAKDDEKLRCYLDKIDVSVKIDV
jgi:hypothetical protein